MTALAFKYEDEIDEVADLLAHSRSILFITGAGISADSGLPTYRQTGCLYNIDTSEDGLPIERALAGDFMRHQPELAWKYFSQIEHACRRARPNRAHEVIAEMEEHFERVWTLTQNIDGFHHAGGARNVIDIHGDLHNLRCPRCRHRQTVPDYSGLTLPPRCPQCSTILRPDVVLFGETLPIERLVPLFLELDEGFDLIFTVGTSSVFSYVAEPVRLAALDGRPTVEINPETTEVSHLVDIRLPLRAAPALDAIWRACRRRTAPAASSAMALATGHA